MTCSLKVPEPAKPEGLESSISDDCSSLFIAAKHNHKEMVEYLLGDDHHYDSSGVTALMVALKEGNIEIARLLLNNQGHERLTETDNDDKNVFHHAFDSWKPEEATEVLVEFIYSQDFTSHEDLADDQTATLHIVKRCSEKMKDLLTAKDLNENTPFHVLARKNLDRDRFENIFEHLKDGDVLECLKERNSRKETPLHKAAKNDQTPFIEAVLELDRNSRALVENLLTEKDENCNTPLHLSSQAKKVEISPLLEFVRHNTREPVKYFSMKNIFGWTPFSAAVASGNIDMVQEMLRDLNNFDKAMLVNQPDFSNTGPLHLAAKYGHVKIFNLLLTNQAEITRRGPDQRTALSVAIEREQRGIIQAIIKGPTWQEAFQIPSSTANGDLDTPLRKLIRQLPDLAEEFLDKCCVTEVIPKNENDQMGEVEEVIRMNYDFIEDTHKYRIEKPKSKRGRVFFHNKDEEHEILYGHYEKEYVVDIYNHPMMIMAEERKVDLLQHPVCLAIILKKWAMYGRRLLIHHHNHNHVRAQVLHPSTRLLRLVPDQSHLLRLDLSLPY